MAAKPEYTRISRKQPVTDAINSTLVKETKPELTRTIGIALALCHNDKSFFV